MAITNFIPTVWSETLFQELNKQYIGVANCNRDFEGEIREKGDTVRICGVNPVTVSNYVKNQDMSAPETLSDNMRELVINNAKYFNFQIDDVDHAQCTPKLMSLALQNAANALANAADKKVYDNYLFTSFNVDCLEPDTSNILDAFLDARKKLMENGVTDASDIVYEVSPFFADMILRAKMELYRDNTAVWEKGCIGELAGSKIYVSPNIPEVIDEEGTCHKCFARTKRAIAFAEQLSEIEAYRPERRFADAVKGLHLFGTKIVYPKEFVTVSLYTSMI